MASHKKQPAATRPNQPQRQQASSKPVKQTLEDPLQMTLSFDNGPQLASPRVSDFTEKQRNPEGTSKSGLDNPFEEWGHKYIIGGVEMRFPFKPYPSQIQMMAKIIQALQRSQNAILESPTGSGKSLALLCAVLAWREYEKQRLISEWQQKLTEKKQKHQQQQQEQEQAVAVDSGAPDLHETLDDVDESLPLPPRFHDIDDDDFQPLPKSRKPAADAGVGMSRKPGANVEGKENVRPGNVELGSKREKGAVITVDELALEKTGKLKLPKIYFGSRTHKQISQIVKELKTNTIYRPRMAILGSRNHMCIHPEVSTSSNKNERCTEMLDEDSCSYFHNVRPLRSHKSLQPNGYNAIWDIEDLVKLGKKQKGCPYFTSRALAETADIVFCPYNYLVDPLVREAMDINLEDSIIILDEAHNIEDAAREASSFEVTEADLRNLEKELENKIALDILLEQYRVILHIINTFLIWISNPESTYSMKEYERYVNLWSGQQLVAKLDAAGINPSTYKTTLKPALDKLLAVAAEEIRQRVEDRNGASDRERQLVTINYDHGEEEPLTSGKSLSISTKALKILEGVFMVFGYIFQEDRTFIDDYKMALIKKIQRKKFGQQDLPAESEWIYQLGFWCLNPGVTFHAISSMARSIILTSGTLSPMESFASELQADFPIRLEANHVINSSQVWAGVIPVGPAGTEFSGTFKNMEVLKYQDDLGGALLRLVEAVPFGVLCFMPSYSAMEKFVRRWKATGLYKQISKKKFVIEESQSTAKSDFEKELGKFYGYVQKAKNGSSGEKDGALFFAVYRGKVSEGIDFTDDNCRAVIAIGIPYPHVNDIQVKLKREYNENKCSKGKKVLSGSAWYDIQAFRAINQALGRCIRHRKDWGAIILLEHRFLNQRNISGLSKWIRNITEKYNTFETAMESLSLFTKRQLIDDVEGTTWASGKENIDTLPNSLVIATQRNDKVDAIGSLNDNSAQSKPSIVPSLSKYRNNPSFRPSVPMPFTGNIKQSLPGMSTPELLLFESPQDPLGGHNNTMDAPTLTRPLEMGHQPKHVLGISNQNEKAPPKIQVYTPKSATALIHQNQQNTKLPPTSNIQHKQNTVFSPATTDSSRMGRPTNIKPDSGHYDSTSYIAHEDPHKNDGDRIPLPAVIENQEQLTPKSSTSHDLDGQQTLRCRVCRDEIFYVGEKSSASLDVNELYRYVNKSYIKELSSRLHETYKDAGVNVSHEGVRVFEVWEDALLGTHRPFASPSTNNFHRPLTMPVSWCSEDHLCYAELCCKSPQNRQVILGVRVVACDAEASEEDRKSCGRLWVLENAVIIEHSKQQDRINNENWDDLVDVGATYTAGVVPQKRRKVEG